MDESGSGSGGEGSGSEVNEYSASGSGETDSEVRRFLILENFMKISRKFPYLQNEKRDGSGCAKIV